MEVKITIIRTKNISAKAIHIGMWLWCVLRGLKPEKCYNHCEIRYGDVTSGAIEEGVKSRAWDDFVKKHENKYFEWIDYPITLTNEQLSKGLLYLKQAENTPYEFENFWFHFLKIFTGKWKGSKNASELYCYEHGIRFVNATGNYNMNPFSNPYQFKKMADANLKE